MYHKIRELFAYIPKGKISTFIVIIGLMLISVCLEIIGFGILIPTIEILFSEKPNESSIFKYFYNFVNVDHAYMKSNLTPLFGVIMLIYFIKNAFLLFFWWKRNNFIKVIQTDISIDLFGNYLYLPWKLHLNKNSSDIIRNLEHENIKIGSTINSIIELITEILIFTVIVALLIIWKPLPVLLCISIFLVVSVLFLILSKRKINDLARKSQKYESAFFKICKEALGSLKEIKVLKIEKKFMNEYSHRLKAGANYRLLFAFFQVVPKYIFEVLAILFVLIISIFLFKFDSSAESLVVVMGVLVLAIVRLLPSFNKITVSLQHIRYGFNSIKVINKEYEEFKIHDLDKFKKIENKEIKFNNKIELQNINFSYLKSKDHKVLNNLCLNIKKGEIIGLMGPSGSGKTTLIDLIIGLLDVYEGKFLVDEKLIDTSNKDSWQKKVGYIPQNFFLFDETIKNNICMDTYSNNEDEKIDKEVLEILEQLQMKKFIQELPEGINTFVGEAGIRLSGGQRQRLGIARALFHNPEILVLDEATNALDEFTEKKIMEIIYSYKNKKTIIISTHDKKNLYKCDHIYEMENGNLKKSK